MRHGEALSPQKDPERGLTDNGKFKIEQVATHLKDSDVSFNQIFHSKKKRARETAEIMGRITSPKIHPVELKHIAPNDDPHLPFVPNLMTLLTGQDAYLTAISFETGTIVCLERNNKAGWNLNWSTSPSEI